MSARRRKRIFCERRYNSAGYVHEVTDTGDDRGTLIFHHPMENCGAGGCPFHDPSDHLMVEWPMSLRETGLIERVCIHGIGHPDPDSVEFYKSEGQDGFGVHGCDGCCRDPLAVLNTKLDRVVKIAEGS